LEATCLKLQAAFPSPPRIIYPTWSFLASILGGLEFASFPHPTCSASR